MRTSTRTARPGAGDLPASSSAGAEGTVIPAPAPPGEPSEDASAEELLSVLKSLDPGDPRCEELRERVMMHYQPLLNRIAHRYGGRGEQLEDLRQTAHVGLAKAIRGYSPERGKAFISYLLPTVTGEIKRHFRDHTWSVHTPRTPQSRRPEMNRVRRELEQRLARDPKPSEIAEEMGISEQEVEEVLLVSEAYNTLSLNAPEPHGEDGTPTLEESLGTEDHNLDLVVERESAREAIKVLPPRERLILKRRFFDEWKQERIAREVGCSQMHVSRLLSASLQKLRDELTRKDDTDRREEENPSRPGYRG
ncbi:SigB/SigF/SigG family RNA polymerase sigma factor [Nocardiopsis exhalans]|uniref:SigB/SigF/SigG family RNA polymerase sigma factor n=1 Tax=Nocardiopsis exhalans TaxID=163604 RepID=A0ABY5DER4_9ACTN|nr:SigB/SigF/SigG family RNA polymerase sigma factor [Nocardiopsis exhalans]USY22846.1 SigB/SigF/SigG family RNA polymerase sigma factor [Nocardiopsis exhalans]